MKFTNAEWITWVGGLITAVACVIGFAYSNFETKGHTEEIKVDLVQRLDRIENKLDQLRQAVE